MINNKFIWLLSLYRIIDGLLINNYISTSINYTINDSKIFNVEIILILLE